MTSVVRLEEEASIVNIIKYKNPSSLPLVSQPVVHQLEYVGFWVLSAGDLDEVGNVTIALFESGLVTRVDPENPRFGRSLLDPVRIFDGELRLAFR